MTDTTLDIPQRESSILRSLKSMALLRESAVGMVGAGIIVFWVIIALFAPLLAPFPPNATLFPLGPIGQEFILDAGASLPMGKVEEICAPIRFGDNQGKFDCGTFWLGTDHIGRDILSRIIHGSRQVLIFAPLATFCAYAVGIPMGLAAGYRRGVVDDVLSFVANVILSFPVLVLYVIIIATIGASAINIVIAVTFASAPGIMRIVRGLVLDLRNREYVFAAETRGETPWRIMLVEILPNARGPLIVDACLPGATDLIGEVRGLPGGDKVKIYYCLIEGKFKHMMQGKRAGADDFLLKPFDREILTKVFSDQSKTAA